MFWKCYDINGITRSNAEGADMTTISSHTVCVMRIICKPVLLSRY